MAGIISRFKDIMSSNINALLDKAEDPSKMIDQYLRNLESDLGKVKAETASVMAEEKRSKREFDECNQEVEKMQKYAERALISGNENDARIFLEKKNELVKKQQTLYDSYSMAAENASKMREMHDKLVKDIGQLNSRRDELKAKLAVAKTQERLNKIGSSLNGAKGNLSAFDKMEAKINKQLDEASAMSELNTLNDDSSIDELMSKYDEKIVNPEVDDELAELKKKLGL